MSPFAAYLAGMGTVAAAIGIGFAGGVMLTSTDFIQKDHAQVARESRPADKPDPAPVMTIPTDAAASAGTPAEPRMRDEHAEQSATAATPTTAQGNSDHAFEQDDPPQPPPLQDRRAADAAPGMLLTPARPQAQVPPADRSPMAQRASEPATGTIARNNKKKSSEKKDASRKAKKQIAEPVQTAPAATTGAGTREPATEEFEDDDEALVQAPERPYGVLDMLIGR